MTTNNLVSFIQHQFGRGIWWCWETIIEEVASNHGIELDDDRVTYAGGALRTGRCFFQRNNDRWKALCNKICNDTSEARQVLNEVTAAVSSDCARGIAARWYAQIREAPDIDVSKHRSVVSCILNWEGLVYRQGHNLIEELNSNLSVVYALWRLNANGRPISRLPLYIGESVATVLSRIQGQNGHRNWWGDGKPIGITLCRVEPSEREQIEKHLIRLLVPFCNGIDNCQRLSAMWNYPRPGELT